MVNRSRWVSFVMVFALALSLLSAAPFPVFAGEGSIETLKLTSSASHTVNIGQSFTIDLGGNTAKSYKSSDPEIAKVSRKGKVSPLKAGGATITVKLPDKTKWKLKLTVIDPTMPTKVTLNYTGKVSIDQNESLQLKATLSPETAVSGISWKSSDKTVATVSKGLVKPKKTGTVTITAKTKRGKKIATVKVKIVDKHQPTSIRIDQGSTVTLAVKAKLQLSVTAKAKLLPAVTTYTWTSSNKKVATVSKKGLVKAKKKGTAKITVKTANGKKAKITVKVVKSGSAILTPTIAPTAMPTEVPTAMPTEVPTAIPTEVPTAIPTEVPTETPTQAPVTTPEAISTPSPTPTQALAPAVEESPTPVPTSTPVPKPTDTGESTVIITPTTIPTATPSPLPTQGAEPTEEPTPVPTAVPPTVTPWPTATSTPEPTVTQGEENEAGMMTDF